MATGCRTSRGWSSSPQADGSWASWCGPGRAEFGLPASASAHNGHQVAFLGADVNDATGDANAFLAQHPVSYSSYQMSTQQVTPVRLMKIVVGVPSRPPGTIPC